MRSDSSAKPVPRVSSVASGSYSLDRDVASVDRLARPARQCASPWAKAKATHRPAPRRSSTDQPAIRCLSSLDRVDALLRERAQIELQRLGFDDRGRFGADANLADRDHAACRGDRARRSRTRSRCRRPKRAARAPIPQLRALHRPLDREQERSVVSIRIRGRFPERGGIELQCRVPRWRFASMRKRIGTTRQ